ncbi:hypothetical protein ACSBR2_038126 [Camellia fascicularis]
MDRRKRLGTTLLLGMVDLSTLTSKETTITKKLVTRFTERKTSARLAMHQRMQNKAGTITKITSRYGRTDAYGGTRK